MILTGEKIFKEWEKNNIVIYPYNTDNLKANSYDITLSPYLLEYSRYAVLDCKLEPTNYTKIVIPKEGWILYPNKLYLGTINEEVGSYKYVPFIEGKSSLGRLGLSIHQTAGRGDLGFTGKWTLELSVLMPLRVYPDMPIGQFVFFKTKGNRNIDLNYDSLKTSKYSGEGDYPEHSKMYKNFIKINKETLDMDNNS